jgi:rhodanese-related sulfurtransferase
LAAPNFFSLQASKEAWEKLSLYQLIRSRDGHLFRIKSLRYIYTRGVRMDTIFQRKGKSENLVPVSLAQDFFHYCLKLMKFKNVKFRDTAVACHSGVQAMVNAKILAREGIGKVKVLKDKMFVWQEKET